MSRVLWMKVVDKLEIETDASVWRSSFTAMVLDLLKLSKSTFAFAVLFCRPVLNFVVIAVKFVSPHLQRVGERIVEWQRRQPNEVVAAVRETLNKTNKTKQNTTQ